MVPRATRWSLTLVVLAVVAYFFVATLLDNWSEVSSLDYGFNAWTAGAMGLFALSVMASGALWAFILRKQGAVQVSLLKAIRAQALAWLLKYVPGQVGALVYKVAWARDHGISKSLTVLTFIYEHAFQVVLSIIPGLALLSAHALNGEYSKDSLRTVLAAGVATLAIGILIHPPVFRRTSTVVLTRLGRQPPPREFFLSGKRLSAFLLGYLAPRLLNGTAFVLVAISVLRPPPELYLVLGISYVFAEAVGLLAIAMPSGIGVREGVIVLVLTPYFPAPEAIALALVARFYCTLADLLVLAIYGSLRLTDA